MSTDATAGDPLIPGYAGHADAIARRLSDQQVRAWVGEILVDLEDRIPIDGIREQFEAVLLRCEFGDQHVIKAVEDDRFGAPDLAQLVEECDRKLIAVADRAKTIGPDELGALLGDLDHAFSERAATIEAHLPAH